VEWGGEGIRGRRVYYTINLGKIEPKEERSHNKGVL
jgi:hypothetical protein